MARWKNSDVISAVSAAFAIPVFVFGIWQYRSAENWKRSEFVAAQIKEFNADKIHQAVLLMLDYDRGIVELFPERPNPSERFVEVPIGTLTNAIAKNKDFQGAEFQIKQYFEHFLVSLGRLNNYLTSGAIEPTELCADMGYYVKLMNGDARVREKKLEISGTDIAPLAKAVRGHFDGWDYDYAKQFFERILKACK
jgi:hypothetical protein